jgi:hypothetical protein
LTAADFRRALRFAIAITVSTAFVYAAQIPIGFLCSVLVASLLSTRAPRPAPLMLFGVAAAIAGALAFGSVISLVSLQSPLIYYLAITLLLYRIFLGTARGAPSFPMLMLLLGVVLLPVLGLTSTQLSFDFAEDFVNASLLSLAIVWLAHWLLPDKSEAVHQIAPAPPPLLRRDAHDHALARTLALLPLLFLVVSLQQTDQLKMLMYAAILIQAPGAAGGRMAGRSMIMGSVIGGAAAVVISLLTTLYFSFALLLLLVLIVSLVIGAVIFSERPLAATFAKAPAAMLILMDKSDKMFGDSTSDALTARLIALGLATLYVVFAYQLIEHLQARMSSATFSLLRLPSRHRPAR